ncbi:ComF family protein [Gudongella oleilytica]|uniref:ComF family protein n=1 Tax=Gudongella oleilytica TaxID=1582259 RepID=UPI000FF8A677|nr:ComF family protein [Gudongella oleilytica]
MLFKLLFPTENFCYFCKDDTPYLEGRLCRDCRDNYEPMHRGFLLRDDSIERVYASVFYNSFARELVHQFKFNDKSYLYEPIAHMMHMTIIEESLTDFDLIVPVPIHWRKEAIRGYNQSQLLAEELSRRTGIPVDKKSLVKSSWTKEQNRLTKYQREENLKGSFSIKDGASMSGRRILLIDDIYTTGNTLKSCASQLKKAGAKEVTGLVFATMNG